MEQPKLRFIREDGTEYPEWEKGCLSDITKKVNRTAKEDSTAPIMMISQRNGFIHQSEKYSRDNAGKSLEKYTLLKYGEMAYNHGASKAKPYGVTFCLQEEKEARVPFVYHAFCIANGVPKYWNYALNTSQMDRQLKKMVSSGARMDGLLNINYDTYMQTKVFMPCLEEQQKIANFLSTVDEVIAQSEAEVQNLEQQKKAAMQKIFSQEVRFRREDGTEFTEWEEARLETVATILMGQSPSGSSVNEEENGIPLVQGKADILGYGIVPKRYTSSPTKINEPNDIIMTVRAPVGFVAKLGFSACIGRGACAIRPNGNADFIFYLLQYKENEWKYIEQGSTFTAVNSNDIGSLEVSVPCLEEQQRIADFLSAYDEAISYAKQEFSKWKELKKGLLQQMFV